MWHDLLDTVCPIKHVNLKASNYDPEYTFLVKNRLNTLIFLTRNDDYLFILCAVLRFKYRSYKAELPGVAQVTHSYIRRLAALGHKSWFLLGVVRGFSKISKFVLSMSVVIPPMGSKKICQFGPTVLSAIANI